MSNLTQRLANEAAGCCGYPGAALLPATFLPRPPSCSVAEIYPMMPQWSKQMRGYPPASPTVRARPRTSEQQTAAPLLWPRPFESLWRQASFPNGS